MECPVCTLYLREGISLKQHLDTHPKDLVIDALLRASSSSSNFTPNSGAVQQTSAQPPPPQLTAAPQLTTAVTYQQILTTNAAGAVVPQFLQIPTFINPSYSLGQNYHYPPHFLSPAQPPFVSNNFSFNVNPDATVPSQEENNNVEEKDRLESDEMELASPEETTASVIISRESPIKDVPEPCEDPLCPSTSSVVVEKPADQGPTPLPCDYSLQYFDCDEPTEDDLKDPSEDLKESAILHSHSNSPDLSRSPRSEQSSLEDGSISKEESVIVEPKPQLISESFQKSDIKLEHFVNTWTINEGYADADGDDADMYPDFPHAPLHPCENMGSSFYDDTQHSDDAMYTNLVPPTALKDGAASSSQPFVELENIRIFFNGSSEESPKSSSVIHMADSTKPDLYPMNLNIAADESMPARGELSEQESMCADSAWGMFQQDVKLVGDWSRDVKAYKCSACNISFSCPKERRVHKNEVHAKPGKAFRCTLCDAVFSNLRERREHAKVHSTVKVEIKKEEPTSTVRHCRHCPATAETAVELRTHLREAHGLIRFSCKTCSSAFDTESEFNEHLKVHPLKCDQCEKLFYRRAYLNLHVKRHLAIKPFCCHLCAKSFITRQKLDEHVNGHAGIKPIKCSLCDKTFSRHSNLIQHRNIHHGKLKKKVRDYICTCGEVFQSQRKLEWHREIHDAKPKSCPYCSQKFIHAASVTRHVRRAHFPDYLPDGQGRESENVACPVCNRIYLRSSLSVHMRSHNGDRPHQCSICSKQFTTKWNMELHQWTHQSRASMPHKCTQCKAAFFRLTDYHSHLNSHKNLRPYICNICGQKFIRKYNCLRHQEEHRRSKQFTCGVAGCHRTFHRSYYLKDHMKVHTGQRPHTCHICGKASSTKSNHNKHVRIHDTREPINSEN